MKKAKDCGKTWWDCEYCHLAYFITKQQEPCSTCDKARLDGASPKVRLAG